jgi:hypothetical protein
MMFLTSTSIAPMSRPAFLIGLVASLICTTAFAGETITAQEVEGYFYADGEMKRSDPQFENTYYVEGDTVTRTRVYDLNKEEVIPDNTVYQIQRQLVSEPSKGLSLSPVIRAIGQPGTDALEILVIGDTHSVREINLRLLRHQ